MAKRVLVECRDLFFRGKLQEVVRTGGGQPVREEPFEPAVVEARPRVGRRILTLHDPRSPVPLELGAEFIHGEGAETLPLAQAAGLAVLELPGTQETATAGRFKPMGDFWELVDRMNHDLA